MAIMVAILIIQKNLEPKKVKLNLDKIKESFCFLFVGHWLQGDIGEDRKNVGLMLKTFLETFKNKKKKPALVMKTMSGAASIMDREDILKKIDAIRKGVTGSLPNVYLIHGEIEDGDMNHLYNHPKIKAMVSFTKGEGFGRPLLEFSLIDKPIIASGWSGQLDFLHKDYTALCGGKINPIDKSAQVKGMLIEGTQWFDVDHNYVNHFYNDVINNYNGWVEKAKNQGKHSRDNFNFNKMKDKISEILSRNLKELPKKMELKLPGMDKIKMPKKNKLKIVK